MAESEFQSVADLLPEPMLLVTVDGTIRAANRSLAACQGGGADQLRGRRLEAIVADPPEAVAAYLRSCTRQGARVTSRLTLRTGDGRLLPCRCEGVPYSPDGAPASAPLLLRLIPDPTASAERRELAETARPHGDWFGVTLASIGDAVIACDTAGRITFMNPVAEGLTGWPMAEATGRPLEEVFRIVHEQTGQPVENPVQRVLREGTVVGLANHICLLARDNRLSPIDDSAAPIRDRDGTLQGVVLVFRDVTERRRQEAALYERVRLAAFGRDIGLALTQSERLPEMLHRCAQAMVQHLDAAFARIWTLHEADNVLELQASAGLYTHLDGPHSRVPVGRFKIGLIAQERQPHLTNAVVGDPRVGDQEWARREGMVAFAGYPLLVEERLVGVMALFARHPLSEATLDAMASVANGVALGVERQRAALALRASEARKAAILATALDGIITKDHEGRISEFNPAAEGIFGYRRADVVGLLLADLLVPPRLRQRHQQGLTQYLATGEGPVLGKRIEMPALRSDGREFPVELAITHIPTEGPPLFTAHVRDISERKRVEQRQHMQFAVNAAPAQSATAEEALPRILQAVCEHLHWDLGTCWLLDPATDVLRCQHTWHAPSWRADAFLSACHGHTFQPGVGLPGRVWAAGKPAWILDVIRDSNFPRAPAALQDGLHGAFACPLLLGAEVLGIVEFFSREVREPDPELLEAVAALGSQVGQFLERRRAEQSLRRNEGRLSFLAEASATLAGLVDPDSTVRKVVGLAVPSLADCCLLDLLGEDGQVRRMAAFLPSGHAAGTPTVLETSYRLHADAVSPVAQVLREGRPILLPTVSPAVLGSLAVGPHDAQVIPDQRVQACLCVPLSVRDRLLGALVLLGRDRPYGHADLGLAEELGRRAAVALDNARMYQEAKDAERRKDLFLSQLAHELRGPLAPLSNALHVLQQLGVGGDMVGEVRDLMRRQVEQLTRLVDDLLDLSRIGQGKIQLRREVADLPGIVHRAVEIARPLIESRRHELAVVLPQEAVYLEVDPGRLVQVLANLLTNAAKYTEESGRIWLTAAAVESEVLLRVRDTGTGIPKEMLPRIFDLFTQLDRPLERA